MHIFIDESGTFSPVPPERHSVSVVGALIVPDCRLELLFRKYAQLRQTLPKARSGEVKGKLLSESQIARVCNLLLKNSCIFEATAIDMALETTVGIVEHRAWKGRQFTSGLTPDHDAEVVRQAFAWRETLDALPTLLYVQSFAMIETIAQVLYGCPMYYSMRWPKELSAFHWTVDAKELNKITSAEIWWSDVMVPLLELRSLREPMDIYDGGDYRYFMEEFGRDTPDRLKPHANSADGMLDLYKLLKGSFRFSSEPEFGLELVDIVTNATRRAIMGNLQRAGWSGIPRMMLHRKDQYLTMINLTELDSHWQLRPYATVVAQGFAGCGRRLRPRS